MLLLFCAPVVLSRFNRIHEYFSHFWCYNKKEVIDLANSIFKHKKMEIVPFILLVVMIGGLYIGVHQAKRIATFFSTQGGPVNIVTGQVNQENIHLNYPQIEGLANGLVQNKINAQIVGEANAFMEPMGDASHSVDSRYSIEFNKNSILSLTLHESHYRKPMAHPMHYLNGMTVNTTTGQVLQLGDLFKAKSDYQGRLTAIINQQIIEKDLHLFKPFEGVNPKQEFYLTTDGIVIYYQLYYYTPYVYGFLKFNIPYGQVADIMQSGFIK